MTPVLFEGSPQFLQGTLLDEFMDQQHGESSPKEIELQRLSSSIHQAFSAFDNEGALLVAEAAIDAFMTPEERAGILDHVAVLARETVRRGDIVEKIDQITLAICLPGSGRIGMTRVADALRQRVWSTLPMISSSEIATTVTIGAVHTTEAHLLDPNELLLAARVNLDSARAAGGNRTNWSDWNQV